MARKIGKLGGNRAGTGKITLENTSSDSEKWTGAVAAQVATAASVKGIITKTIPIQYINTDPDNPRKLALDKALIEKIARDFPVDKRAIQVTDPSEWLEGYIERVTQGAQLEGKQLGDFESIAGFAAALKSAERLLHPIVVWKEESTFHLIAGERRLLAHILLGESHIAARIQAKKLERTDIDTLQWEENVHREEMTLWERVDRVRKIIEAGEGLDKTSVTKLSKIIGRSRAESQRYLAILRCPVKALMASIEGGKIGDLKKAAALAQLSAEDLNAQLLGRTMRPAGNKAIIKLHKSINSNALSIVIAAAAQQLQLSDSIKGLDSGKPADLAQALEILVKQVGEQSND